MRCSLLAAISCSPLLFVVCGWLVGVCCLLFGVCCMMCCFLVGVGSCAIVCRAVRLVRCLLCVDWRAVCVGRSLLFVVGVRVRCLSCVGCCYVLCVVVCCRLVVFLVVRCWLCVVCCVWFVVRCLFVVVSCCFVA